MSEHKAIVSWKSTSPDFLKGKYSREHTWMFDGGLMVQASPSPSVVPPPLSNPANVDPEEAFVAAVSSCHMLTYLYLASKQGFQVDSYSDEAVGVMTKNEKGVPWVSLVTLHPKISYSGEKLPDPADEERLHHQAHAQCFIANSIKSQVIVEAAKNEAFLDHGKKRVGGAAFSWQSSRVNHYERIARVIQYLDEHYTEQPDLEILAGHIGLSPFHFHRLFVSWAGVTPKDFIQCLTVNHAKELLRRGESVLNTALDVGLSGPGRLHDLCVNLEAASPGELKSGGADCEMRFGLAETPFGEWLSAENARGVCHVSFVGKGASASALASLRESWPEARFSRDDAVAERLASIVFNRTARPESRLSLRTFVRGSAFQIRVWRALLQVPSGALVSYGQIAAAIGHPKAARAVGTAVGQNPLAFLIPCHRVIRETGVVGAYRWGATRKRAIIGWEASPCTACSGIGGQSQGNRGATNAPANPSGAAAKPAASGNP